MNTLLSLNAAVSCYYLMAIVLLLALGSVEATPASCSAQPPAKLCCYKTQLLFLLDRSATQAITNITEPINFMKRTRCFFEEGRVQTGLIVFNRDVKTVIPLGSYSADDWYTALDNAVPTIQPTSRFTPMAEAFWLARRTFEQNPDSPCDPINRVVVLMSDGFPVQNMPPKNSGDTVFGIGGDAGIPTTYLSKPASSGANLALIGDYAEYNEHWVPYEAKRLKEETGSRIITVAMKGTDTLSARVSYFTGEIDPTYACRNPSTPPTRSPTVVPAPTSKPVSNMPACVAGQSPETTQCYRRRVHKKTGTVADPGDGVAKGYGGTLSTYSECYVRNSTLFPIASCPDHVIGIEQADDFFTKALAGIGPLACPRAAHCQKECLA